jgi:hypothetical protein
MTQSAQSPNEPIVSLPVAQLKVILQSSNDDALTQFMHGYSIGFAADQFIGIMAAPNQRVEFFIAIAKTYPDDWKKAVDLLQGGAEPMVPVR